jgi:hypothetical protein
MSFSDKILQMFLRENWEEPLAQGYTKVKSPEGATTALNNDDEAIAGDTEFPTYDGLKKAKSGMTDYNKRFTQTYDEWQSHKEGQK